MRIMVDTNVFISAILFPESLPSKAVKYIIDKHKLVLCPHIIDEMHYIFQRKFKNKLQNLEKFLSKLSFELIYTPLEIDIDKYPEIRDTADLPILASAIIGEVDIIITGDKDFSSIVIDRPKIYTPRNFLDIF